VADHYALFWDGPCAKTTRKLDVTDYLRLGHYHLPDTLQCGGRTYVRGTPPADLDPTYFVAGGKFAPGVTVAGEADVFRAWSQLHKTLNSTVGRQRLRIANAGRRIRRAVR
jgi:hypothetical protein